jgi:mannose-1-phosphate guanylyltransferase
MDTKQHDLPWSIVLAGGEGERIKPLVMRWLGRHKPKQYCTFTGHRSMLVHTLSRAERLSGLARTVTVIARSHRQEANPQFEQHPCGTVVEQPLNRDTAAGVFLPLAFIKARDPKALVVVYPSDHFVYPEERFVWTVRSAVFAAEKLGEKLVLLGVTPSGIEMDYGWIRPGAQLDYAGGSCVRRVEGFCEKPGPDQAREVFAAGALWNTLIFAAKADTLWRMGWRYIPEIMPLFETLCKSVDTPRQQRVLDQIYSGMPRRNFSSDLLARATAEIAVIAMENVLWSDWGRPERIVDTLSGMGKAPAFPLGCLVRS